MKENYERHSTINLGMGQIVLEEVGEEKIPNPKTMRLGLQHATIGIRSNFQNGWRFGSDILFVIPGMSIAAKQEIFGMFFIGTKTELPFFQVEHEREYAKTLWGRSLKLRTIMLKGVWENPDLLKDDLIFRWTGSPPNDLIRIEKDLSFLDKIKLKIRGWKS